MLKLVFTVDATGHVALKVEGAAGPGCHSVTREAEELLGPAVHRERTREYHDHVRTSAPRQAQST